MSAAGSAQATVGVIGHVDHGKTSLVRALTGIDTDRLPEEKSRGLSIVPGYAWLELDDGCVDLIDVPGHEQFVRMMVAGATGIDAVLLAIDGREGIKPQTREHLAIAELLGVSRGIVAVTKADRLSSGERRAAIDWLRGLVRGTQLQRAPVVFTSAVDGEGLAALRQALQALLHAPSARRGIGDGSQPTHPFVTIDRSFALPGAGTVVTGTLQFGPLCSGDRVRVLPGERELVVRRLQVHGRDAQIAWPGQRVGLNLRGAAHHELRRGDAVAALGGLAAAGDLLNADVVIASDVLRDVRDGQRLRLLIGTADVEVRLRLLGGIARLRAREACYAQLQCERPVPCTPLQPFVLRDPSPAATVGGGRVLEVAKGRLRRSDPSALLRLGVLSRGDGAERIAARIADAGTAGVSIEGLARALPVPAARLCAIVETLAGVQRVGDFLFDAVALRASIQRIEALLRNFHATQPALGGMPVGSLRAKLPEMPGGSSLAAILQHGAQRGLLVMEGGSVRLAAHDPWNAIGPSGQAVAARIEASFRQGRLMPPDVPAVIGASKHHGMIFRLLLERGILVSLPAGPGLPALAFHRQAIDSACEHLRSRWPPPARFTLSQARELLGSTRKYVVPLMEYLDARGVTVRYGDQRAVAADRKRSA
ncbi:MAG TPA: selenocysteine-specific translation elongation factor [Burkholderiaceae bacterium]|nr:selenocysteine-specific translation elongation factor [Burkholderiaceae bacterium]